VRRGDEVGRVRADDGGDGLNLGDPFYLNDGLTLVVMVLVTVVARLRGSSGDEEGRSDGVGLHGGGDLLYMYFCLFCFVYVGEKRYNKRGQQVFSPVQQ
jgi:hypothetical protein